MNAADAALIRNVRRELGRRPIEAGRVDIQATNGHVTLTGTMTRLRSQPGVDLQSEMDTVTKIIMRGRDVRDVSSMVRLREDPSMPAADEETRGRRRR